MAILEDIKKSISQMTEEELLLHHTEIRKNRLYRKPTTPTTSVDKKAKAVTKLGLSKEELEKMIKELDDEKTDM